MAPRGRPCLQQVPLVKIQPSARVVSCRQYSRLPARVPEALPASRQRSDFKTGDRVRLKAAGLEVPKDYDWSTDALRPGVATWKSLEADALSLSAPKRGRLRQPFLELHVGRLRRAGAGNGDVRVVRR